MNTEKIINNNNKILMIAATPFFSDRGCHIRIYNEIKYLKKEGIETVLCTYHLGKNIEGFDVKRIKNVSWYKKITPGASWGKIYLDFLLLILSYKEFKKLKPKIIHAHLYEGLLIAFLVKMFSFTKVTIIFDCQGSLAEEMNAYTLRKSIFLKPLYYLFLAVEKILLFIPDKTVCSSQNSYDFLISRYKIPKSKIDILDDGIDVDLFKSFSPEEKNKLKKELGISPNSIVFLYTGSISEAKGLKPLLDTTSSILEKKDDFVFIFAGYGDLENEYKIKLKKYIDRKQVFFTGRFAYFDLPKYTAVADYAIEPKNGSSESSGKLFNYVAADLSVICFKSSFNFSILGENGLYIENFSDILYIENLPRITKKISSKFSWGIIIKKLIALYSNNNNNMKEKDTINVLSLVDKSGFGGVQTVAYAMMNHNFGEKIQIKYIFLRNINYRFNMADVEKNNVFYLKATNRFSPLPLLQIRDFILKNDIDIIHCNGNKSLIVGVLVKFLFFRKIKIIEHEHGGIFDDRSLYFLFLRIFKRLLNYTITLTNYRKDLLMKNSKMNEQKIVVVPHFTKIEERPLTDLFIKYKNIIDYDPNLFYLGYLGGLSRIKGTDLLIKLMAKIKDNKKYKNIRLIIAGDGPQKEEWMNLTRELGVADRVYFIGYVKNSQDIHTLFNIAIVPSRSEAFGIVLLETWLNKKPLIVSDIPTLREIVTPNENALIFKKEDIYSLEEQVSKLMDDEELRVKLVVNGFNEAQKYSFDRYCENLINLYNKCYGEDK